MGALRVHLGAHAVTRRARRSRGQALVEFSLFAPVLATILVGAFVAGTGLNDRLVGAGAVRAGVRVAARLGAGDRIGTGVTQADLDRQIVATVTGAARRMPYAHLTELIIYRPGPGLGGGGDVNLLRDAYDRFFFDAAENPIPDPTHQALVLSFRSSETPDEFPIGVRLSWRYRPGAGRLDIGMVEHAVMWTADETTTVYASGRGGQVPAYDVSGRLVTTLVTGSASPFETDACLDHQQNLLVNDFSAGTVTIFDGLGTRVGSFPTSGASPIAESCAIDAAGNIYIGHVDTPRVDKFSPSHSLLRSFAPAPDQHGIDHMVLKPDNCTLLYTSEGDLVKQYDVCTGTQLPDFASLVGQCHQVSLRNNGEVFVGCFTGVYRLTSTGTTLQVYPTGSFGSTGILRSVALDPDGSSFWTADRNPPTIYHVDIQTGGLIKSFPAPAAGTIYGLTVTPQDIDGPAASGGP